MGPGDDEGLSKAQMGELMSSGGGKRKWHAVGTLRKAEGDVKEDKRISRKTSATPAKKTARRGAPDTAINGAAEATITARVTRSAIGAPKKVSRAETVAPASPKGQEKTRKASGGATAKSKKNPKPVAKPPQTRTYDRERDFDLLSYVGFNDEGETEDEGDARKRSGDARASGAATKNYESLDPVRGREHSTTTDSASDDDSFGDPIEIQPRRGGGGRGSGKRRQRSIGAGDDDDSDEFVIAKPKRGAGAAAGSKATGRQTAGTAQKKASEVRRGQGDPLEQGTPPRKKSKGSMGPPASTAPKRVASVNVAPASRVASKAALVGGKTVSSTMAPVGKHVLKRPANDLFGNYGSGTKVNLADVNVRRKTGKQADALHNREKGMSLLNKQNLDRLLVTRNQLEYLFSFMQVDDDSHIPLSYEAANELVSGTFVHVLEGVLKRSMRLVKVKRLDIGLEYPYGESGTDNLATVIHLTVEVPGHNDMSLRLIDLDPEKVRVTDSEVLALVRNLIDNTATWSGLTKEDMEYKMKTLQRRLPAMSRRDADQRLNGLNARHSESGMSQKRIKVQKQFERFYRGEVPCAAIKYVNCFPNVRPDQFDDPEKYPVEQVCVPHELDPKEVAELNDKATKTEESPVVSPVKRRSSELLLPASSGDDHGLPELEAMKNDDRPTARGALHAREADNPLKGKNIWGIRGERHASTSIRPPNSMYSRDRDHRDRDHRDRDHRDMDPRDRDLRDRDPRDRDLRVRDPRDTRRDDVNQDLNRRVQGRDSSSFGDLGRENEDRQDADDPYKPQTAGILIDHDPSIAIDRATATKDNAGVRFRKEHRVSRIPVEDTYEASWGNGVGEKVSWSDGARGDTRTNQPGGARTETPRDNQKLDHPTSRPGTAAPFRPSGKIHPSRVAQMEFLKSSSPETQELGGTPKRPERRDREETVDLGQIPGYAGVRRDLNRDDTPAFQPISTSFRENRPDIKTKDNAGVKARAEYRVVRVQPDEAGNSDEAVWGASTPGDVAWGNSGSGKESTWGGTGRKSGAREKTTEVNHRPAKPEPHYRPSGFVHPSRQKQVSSNVSTAPKRLEKPTVEPEPTRYRPSGSIHPSRQKQVNTKQRSRTSTDDLNNMDVEAFLAGCKAAAMNSDEPAEDGEIR